MSKETPLGSFIILYVNGVSEKFRHIGIQCNIKTCLQNQPDPCKNQIGQRSSRHQTLCLPHTLWMQLELRWGDGQLLVVGLREHQHSLERGSVEKSQVSQIRIG